VNIGSVWIQHIERQNIHRYTTIQSMKWATVEQTESCSGPMVFVGVRLPKAHHASETACSRKEMRMEMSRETREDLQRNFLIGNCKNRPMAWHNDPALRALLGLEDNHYDEPIPFKEVVRRLFNWKPVSVPKANLIPCKKSDANWFMEHEDENGAKATVPVRVSITDTEQGIIRSDTGEHIATHGAGYKIHDYEQWLLRLQSNIIGDSLTILGAGLPRQGAQAYVQVALPNTAFDDKTGLSFLPYIMGSTSLDGSLPTTFGAQSLLVVCDNTRDMALRQGAATGRVYKAKHTSKSLETNRIKDVRESLSIIHQQADNTIAEFHELAAIPVNRREFVKVLDVILPEPAEDASKRSRTIWENKRDTLSNTYFKDPMMNNMQGTALGVIQAINTYETHYATVKSVSRFERNITKTIKGDFGELDRATVAALAQVLDRPELVSAN
jgi:phage/plasmid-like protein (TIGR03299 family)